MTKRGERYREGELGKGDGGEMGIYKPCWTEKIGLLRYKIYHQHRYRQAKIIGIYPIPLRSDKPSGTSAIIRK